jgi:hypothetical protein
MRRGENPAPAYREQFSFSATRADEPKLLAREVPLKGDAQNGARREFRNTTTAGSRS